ncbi:MAG: hypothetical protein ACRCT1_12405 [Microcoleaceae cyanobacterium]
MATFDWDLNSTFSVYVDSRENLRGYGKQFSYGFQYFLDSKIASISLTLNEENGYNCDDENPLDQWLPYYTPEALAREWQSSHLFQAGEEEKDWALISQAFLLMIASSLPDYYAGYLKNQKERIQHDESVCRWWC